MHGILGHFVLWHHWLLHNTALNPVSILHTFLPENIGVPGQNGLQQNWDIPLWIITAKVILQLYVVRGDLVEAVRELGHQVLIPTGQETVDLFCNPPIVQQALGGGGRQRRRERELVQ